MQHRCHHLSLYCNNSTSFLISLVLYRDEIPCLELETCVFLFFFPVGEKISSYKDITNYPTKIDPPILGWIFLPSHNQAPKTHKNTTHLRKSPQKKWWPNYNPITNKRFTRVNCLVIWHPSRWLLARLHFLSKWMQRVVVVVGVKRVRG